MRLLELFGGIGSQTQALTNIGIKHKATLCEIDKYAVQSYEQMHGKTENLGDITKVKAEDLHEGQWDLITYSFPCQSVSVAGKQEGLTKGTGTTSSLLWECEKIISKVKPKYLLMENVANLLSEKFMPEFEKWLRVLKDLGYTNYYQILNAKNYGIPQNRERVFCVSIRGKHSYYQFPQPVPLKLRLKDMLEKDVEEKYYLSDKMVTFLVKNNDKQKELGNGFRFQPQKSEQAEICNSITTRCGGRPTDTFIEQEHPDIQQVGTLDIKGQDSIKRVYSPNGISPTITTCEGGNRQPKIQEDIPQERFFQQAFETLAENDCDAGDTIDAYNKKVNKTGICPTITTRPEGFKTAILPVVENKKEEEPKIDRIGGLYGQATRWGVYNKEGMSPTIVASMGMGGGHVPMVEEPMIDKQYRIRKLTPRECFRLMGFKDEQFDKIKDVSNAQLYKQAGNSIVVNVLEAIFRQLFLVDSGLPQKQEYVQEDLF